MLLQVPLHVPLYPQTDICKAARRNCYFQVVPDGTLPPQSPTITLTP